MPVPPSSPAVPRQARVRQVTREVAPARSPAVQPPSSQVPPRSPETTNPAGTPKLKRPPSTAPGPTPRDILLEVDKETGHTVFKLMDRRDGKVILQVPPEEILAMVRNLRNLDKQQQSTGLLLDKEA
jgi:hypothetical protein